MKTPPAVDTTDQLQEALRPIASLISKSEKAQQKLKPGTWQHTMLQNNLEALRIASALMSNEPETARFTRDELQKALDVFASLISKVEKTEEKFSPGTAQHTLQRNRLEALKFAETQIKGELDGQQITL